MGEIIVTLLNLRTQKERKSIFLCLPDSEVLGNPGFDRYDRCAYAKRRRKLIIHVQIH